MPTQAYFDILEGRREPPPAARLVGFELLALDPEGRSIEAAYHPGDQLANSMGGVQGGVLATMFDNLLGTLVHSTLEPGQGAATTDLHVSFLRPAPLRRLVGRGEVVRRGRRAVFARGELLADGTGGTVDAVLATGSATFLVRGSARAPQGPPAG